MCLCINANGWGNSSSHHVGVGVFLMRGEFDDHLQWPFKGIVTVQLINQREGGEHLEKNVMNEEDWKSKALLRVLEGDRSATGRGTLFIPHSCLYNLEEDKEYLKNNTLKFKVVSVIVKSI